MPLLKSPSGFPLVRINSIFSMAYKAWNKPSPATPVTSSLAVLPLLTTLSCVECPLHASHYSRCWRESIADTDRSLFQGVFLLFFEHSPFVALPTWITFPTWLPLYLQVLCSNVTSKRVLPSLTNLFKVESCSQGYLHPLTHFSFHNIYHNLKS